MNAPPRPIVEADLHAFVDGQMDFERRAVIVQAMASDPELAAKVEQWRRQNEALTATFGSILREPLPLRLMPTNLARETTSRKSNGEEARKASSSDLFLPPSFSVRVVAIAIAAFVAGGAMVFIADALTMGSRLIESRPAEATVLAETRALAIRAYEAHRTFATDLVHSVEVPASDGGHLLKWIQHRLSMAIRIPDLHLEGWTLIGGRIVPGEVGPAAFLIYGNGVERLGLYMARTNLHGSDEFSIYDNGAGLGSVGFWVDEPVGYAITTSRDSAWLERSGVSLHQTIRTQAKDNASAD